jgi:phosphoglycerol transferase
MDSASPELPKYRQWFVAIAVATVTLATTIVALAVLMNWDRVRWDVPFEYDGDSLLMLEIVQTSLERPWYLETPRLGAPGGLQMYDYPCADSLDIVIVKLLGLVDRRPAVVLNLLYVLSFPLAALTMLAAGRRLGLGWAPAAAAGVLFAFLPYHALRGIHHLFLSTYFPIPLMVVVLVEIAIGQLPFLAHRDDGRPRLALRNGRSLWAIVSAVLLGSANPYYAFFALLLLLVAGLVDLLSRRRIWSLISAGMVGVLVAATVTLNMLPSLLYERQHGKNPLGHSRGHEEAEKFGLKLSHLLWPAPEHRSDWNPSIRRFYHAIGRPLENENTNAALGVIAAIGFVGLAATLLVPRPNRPPALLALAQLNLAVFLIGTLGGLGVLVSMLYSQFRCYNRISIFIGCFSLLAVAAWTDAGLGRLRHWPTRTLGLLALMGIVLFGVWDGSTRKITPQTDVIGPIWDADATFVRTVEERLPLGSRVFQLPVLVFPETPIVHDLDFGRSLVGYLHSSHLEWSHATMRGRPGAAWSASVGKQLERGDTRDPALAELEKNGFRALWVDWKGYPAADAAKLRAELRRRLGEPFASRPDGTTECYRIVIN